MSLALQDRIDAEVEAHSRLDVQVRETEENLETLRRARDQAVGKIIILQDLQQEYESNTTIDTVTPATENAD